MPVAKARLGLSW